MSSPLGNVALRKNHRVPLRHLTTKPADMRIRVLREGECKSRGGRWRLTPLESPTVPH